MSNDFDTYNSVPFQVYFSKKDGQEVCLDYINRLLKIQDQTGETKAVVYFFSSINHEINKDELLNRSIDKKGKAYYVYENGVQGHDWLWYYGDLISLDELF
ncbi:MAG: hypothetical protein K1X49_11580 [Saprospiraceae bacterium]|nr:hypothetical protein [Saprospiraceae bacterium]